MRVWLPTTVYQQATKRLEYILREFESVTVCTSGGKDSTVLLELTLQVARKMGKLPVHLFFIDQEAEWQATIDYIEETMTRDEVVPHWLQMPIQLANASNADDPWLWCWKEGHNWMRKKHQLAETENRYNTTRFHKIFKAWARGNYDGPHAYLAGVRASESMSRCRAFHTAQSTYKHINWGKKLDQKRQHFTFYPLYDWTTTDIWHAIETHGWKYCKVYDWMHQHGMARERMRVSNLHHETALPLLEVLQELEPETWEKLTSRLQGISSCGQLADDFFMPKVLPTMFADWAEYRDHLLANLVPEMHRDKMQAEFAKQVATFQPEVHTKLHKHQCKAILSNDYEQVLFDYFRANYWSKTNDKAKQAT